MPDPTPYRYPVHLHLRTDTHRPVVPWVETPLCLRRANGCLELIGHTTALLPTARFVLGYGRYATVQNTDVLRQAVIEEAHRVLRKYDAP